jgi:hypothetical protein
VKEIARTKSPVFPYCVFELIAKTVGGLELKLVLAIEIIDIFHSF